MDNLNDRKVVLLGTRHSIQNGYNSSSSFKSLLNEECEKHQVIAIAEEADKKRETIGYKLTAERNYKHLYADPDEEERKARGIPRTEDIWNDIKNEYSPKYPELKDSWPDHPPACMDKNKFPRDMWIAYNVKQQQSDRKREKIWLENIVKLNLWPLIFICGAAHFNEFRKLLISSGIQVIQSYEDWDPKK